MLVDLKTKLKDLKFGNDQFGYGSSNEPYIQTPIPGSAGYRLFGPDSLIYAATSKGGLDYPARGGAPAVSLGLQTISKFNDIDERRIQKFLESSPKGTLFIQKQIGLQLSNPKTEVATSITGPAEYGPLEITRIYQSSNTLAQVRNQGTGMHGRRHGLNAFATYQDNYYNTVNKQNVVGGEQSKLENRLLNLYSVKIYSKTNPLKIANSYINLEKIFKTGIDQNVRGVLFRYTGGPGSVYGLGETTIYRAVDTTQLGTSVFPNIGKRIMTYDLIRSQVVNKAINESSTNPLTGKKPTKLDIQDFRDKVREVTKTSKDYVSWEDWNVAGLQKGADTVRVGSSANQAYNSLKQDGYQKILNRSSNSFPTDNGKNGSSFALTDFRETPRWTDSDSIDSKFYYSYVSPINGKKMNRYDKINSSYPFDFKNDTEPWNLNKDTTQDLIKFVFEAINNDDTTVSTAIFFRAFLKGNITDNNTGQWNAFNYFGRGEKFYTYQGFERTIGFSFSVPIFSRAELEPTYNRLNALVSQVYPDYSHFGLMRAPIMRLTVGDYIYRMAGFLENVNLTLSGESGWEIEDGTQLPMMIEVQTSFKPIPDELPKRYNRMSVSRLMAQNPNGIINAQGRRVLEENSVNVPAGIITRPANETSPFVTPDSTLPYSTMYTVSSSVDPNAELKKSLGTDSSPLINRGQSAYYEKGLASTNFGLIGPPVQTGFENNLPITPAK